MYSVEDTWANALQCAKAGDPAQGAISLNDAFEKAARHGELNVFGYGPEVVAQYAALIPAYREKTGWWVQGRDVKCDRHQPGVHFADPAALTEEQRRAINMHFQESLKIAENRHPSDGLHHFVSRIEQLAQRVKLGTYACSTPALLAAWRGAYRDLQARLGWRMEERG